MNTRAALGSTLITIIFCINGVLGQSPEAKTINGGVVNGKAVSLVKPAYPAEARAAGVEGSVAVNIVIDEGGNVISAQAEWEPRRVQKLNDDGTVLTFEELHPALRVAAEQAALQSRFSPTLLSGQPVKVKGRIVYNFVADIGDADIPGKKINGGVLNGKAISLPKPDYPPAALAVRAQGLVTVQVVVDEEGRVMSANAVSGHPLLRAASVAAARQASFSPTLLEGHAVKVVGVITYNFTAPKNEKTAESEN